jgi:DNA-binding NtrC family response regulator
MSVTPADSTPRGFEDEAAAGIDQRYLVVFNGAASWMHPLPSTGAIVIGRSETADLRIDDAQVSRLHARLALDDGRVAISDLGSQQGTYVNGVPLSGERALQPGDRIQLHRTTLELHAAPPTLAPIDMGTFRQRVSHEVDRAIGEGRMVSVVCFLGAAPPVPAGSVQPSQSTELVEPTSHESTGALHRDVVQRVALAQLRRRDAVAWSADHALYVLLPDTSPDEAVATAARIRGKLDGVALQIGHVTCPGDGYDTALLLAGAHDAAAAAAPGRVAGFDRQVQTLTIGAQRVIIADPIVVRLYALIERLAPAEIAVLISGETGCGKELVATALHTRSHRAKQRLISLNCAALHDTLVESELFGHAKGAFSGAIANRPGLIEAASGSTLFLDEVGELTLANQAKLLRVLESHRVTRVGDNREREVDVRIVAATNRDLDADVTAGRFRRDLYFRLSAATLYLPPLRQRPHELPLLATAFLEDACRLTGRRAMRVSEGAIRALMAHAWPGNVRELKNLMQYVAATLPVDELLADHVTERLGRLPPALAPRPAPTTTPQFRPLAQELRELEITRIREALAATRGNQTRAAGLLAMPVRTFFEKVKQYGLAPKKRRASTDGH